LFFNTLAIFLKKGFCKIKKDSLGLAKKDKVNKKEKIVNKDISKKGYKV
jgi:hypothetical protein